MSLEVLAFTKAAAKLLSLGISGWTALETAGVGKEEAKALSDALSSAPELRALFGGDSPDRREPLRAYAELVLVAFGEAWRRHWAYNDRLAPSDGELRSGSSNWCRSAPRLRSSMGVAAALAQTGSPC